MAPTPWPLLIATLMAPDGLSPALLAATREAVQATGGECVAEVALDPPFAHDVVVRGVPAPLLRAALETMADAMNDGAGGMDVVVQPAASRQVKQLLVADMDSTMIGQECIDELADFAGKKAEIAAITERAMQGELDFAAALDARVAALAGLAESAIATCLAERIHLMPGAATLIATMRAHGARTVLVSGGFTHFTGPVAAQLGFHRQVANLLHIDNGRLAGTVGRPIVDAAVKRAVLLAEMQALGLSAEATLAVGDGANDIAMLQTAGLGIAYRAKPKASAAADAAIRHCDLRALLWSQGIAGERWVVPEQPAALALGDTRR